MALTLKLGARLSHISTPLAAYYSPTTKTSPQWFADYKNNKFYSKGFVTEPNAMTTELSTPVTVRDSDGYLKWSAHNLLPVSEDLANAAWTKSEVSVVSNVITESTSTSQHYLQDYVSTIESGMSVTIKIEVAKNNDRGVVVSFAASRLYANFNTVAGTVTQVASSAEFTNEQASIEDLGSTYLLTLSGDRVSGTTSYVRVSLSNTTTGSAPSYTGDGSSSVTVVKVWSYRSDLGGMQPNPDTGDSYVPTTTAAVYARPVQYDTAGNRAGMPIPPQRTNQITVSDDMTDASWTKTNITPAKTETGVGGEANGASKLTATAANGTCTFAITSASAVKIASAFVKRITGTGTVEMTLDGGTTWEAVTLTSSFVQVGTASQTITNPTVGFRIVTSGDEIAVQIAQCEGGAFITPGIPTNGATVTRNAVEVKAPKAFVGTDAELTEGTWVLGVRDVQADAGGGVSSAFLMTDTTADGSILIANNGSPTNIRSYNTTSTIESVMGATMVDGGSHKFSIAFEDGSGRSVTGDGATVATDANNYLATNPPAEFYFMQRSDQSRMPGGILEWAVYFPDRLSDAEIATITDAATAYPS